MRPIDVTGFEVNARDSLTPRGPDENAAAANRYSVGPGLDDGLRQVNRASSRC